MRNCDELLLTIASYAVDKALNENILKIASNGKVANSKKIVMGIRNSCIYPYLRIFKFTDGEKHPDDVSDEVIEVLIKMARRKF